MYGINARENNAGCSHPVSADVLEINCDVKEGTFWWDGYYAEFWRIGCSENIVAQTMEKRKKNLCGHILKFKARLRGSESLIQNKVLKIMGSVSSDLREVGPMNESAAMAVKSDNHSRLPGNRVD